MIDRDQTTLLSSGRVIAPDAPIALDFALALIVYPERMRPKLLGRLVGSQCVLLALTQAGMEDAYCAAQRNAMAVRHGDGGICDLLKRDPEITRFLALEAIDGLFDIAYHFNHVDTISAACSAPARIVFGKKPSP